MHDHEFSVQPLRGWRFVLGFLLIVAASWGIVLAIGYGVYQALRKLF